MTAADLPLARRWLGEPHVARWWTEPLDEQLADFELALAGADPTVLSIALVDGRPVGLLQWYRWSDYPQAAEYGAGPDDVGLDYLIGDPGDVGRGLGTALIAAAVAQIARVRPTSALLVSVDATNLASRGVLENNGFVLVDERDIPSEPEPLSALYRRA
jgi:aminoglycoside 6'-N-acetyltransferase